MNKLPRLPGVIQRRIQEFEAAAVESARVAFSKHLTVRRRRALYVLSREIRKRLKP